MTKHAFWTYFRQGSAMMYAFPFALIGYLSSLAVCGFLRGGEIAQRHFFGDSE